MKKNSLAISLFSVFLSGIVLIGSAGMTVIIKHCHEHGYTVSTGILSPASPEEHSCCNHFDSNCSSETSAVTEVSCCTFTTEKLKLTNYLSSDKVLKQVLFDIQPADFTNPVYDIPFAHSRIPPHHNKHGGRDLVISFRQLLI